MLHPKPAFQLKSTLLARLSLLGIVSVSMCMLPSISFAQVEAPPAEAKAKIVQQSGVSLNRVTSDIKYLASDELAGRKPGTPQMKLAEEHIVKAFRDAGLKDPTGTGTYFQTFEVESRNNTIVAGSSSLAITGPKGNNLNLTLGKDYSLLLGKGEFDVDSGLAFVGYGISAEKELNFDEYADIDVKGKVVIVIRREPQQRMVDSVFEGENTTKWSFIATKARSARRAGAKAILLVNDGLGAAEDGDELFPADLFGQDNGSLPLMQIKRSTLDKIFAVNPIVTAAGKELKTIAAVEAQLDRELEPLSQTMRGWNVETSGQFESGGIATSNIIGVLEGEGPHANETIIVGAHYDHLGDGAYGSRAGASKRGQIHNGADDNATGTAAVMELARRFAARDQKPGRRIVFIAFTAEEMGLKGAYHYVDNPVYPLEDTVAMINFDMIGWLRNNEVTLFGWDSAKQFDKMFQVANTDLNFSLQKPDLRFKGSDHFPFENVEIPNTFLHTGLTDTYHTPDDDFETIDCDGVVKVIDLTESFMEQLCQTDKRPRYVHAGPFRLGINVGIDDQGQLLVTTVSRDSIAQIAGIEKGDVILQWGDEKLKSRPDLKRVIRRDRGEKIKLKILREGVGQEIEFKLVRPGEDDEA